VEDTVGAGDAFTAAFITSYMDGESIETAHRYAVDVAAFVCTKKGAMPSYDNSNLILNP
jgi:fructokinase